MTTITGFNRLGRGLDMSGTDASGWLTGAPAQAPNSTLIYDDGRVVVLTFDYGPVAYLEGRYTSDSWSITVRDMSFLDSSYFPLLTFQNINIRISFASVESGLPLNFNFLAGSDLVTGNDFPDMIRGGPGSDSLLGLGGGDRIYGDEGNDTLRGGAGSDAIMGGDGSDTAVLSGSSTQYVVASIFGRLLVVGPDGSDSYTGVEYFRFEGTGAVIAAGSFVGSGSHAPAYSVSVGGVNSSQVAAGYSGPVDYLALQYLGTGSGEVVIGTAFNDFINALGGDDAVDAGAGCDVIDGGTGSNFLSGGADLDIFFLDGRSGASTWSTITDWQPGEQISLWGWRPGVSRYIGVEMDGADGFKGATLHADLDGNGLVETSVTVSGLRLSQAPTPLEFDGLLWFL